jgi:DNA repair protein RadC
MICNESKLKIKDLPLEERPRERLIKQGPKSLSNAELLAIILRTGNKKENVIDLSKRVLNNHNLKSLSRRGVNNLKKTLGIGEAKACQIIACFELGRRLASFNEDRKPKINSARDVAKIFIPEMSSLKKEYFIGIYLNSRRRIIKEETLFIGGLESSLIHPREIFQVALNESAAALILLHNHPSGEPNPSDEDSEVTKQIVNAGEILGIDVLDHIIIGNKRYFSFREKNLL